MPLCGASRDVMAIAGTMLVTSSVCHSTSNSATSLDRPLSVAMSIWRTEARHSLDSCSTMVAVVMIWPAFAWLVMRLAVCTAEPKISRFSSTTGPKLQPMRIATGCSVDLELGVQDDLLLHLRGGVQGIVRGRERSP